MLNQVDRYLADRSTSTRVAIHFIAGASVVLVVSALCSLFYFGNLLFDAEKRHSDTLRSAASGRIVASADLFVRLVERLSAASEVRSSLVDSAGVERHLRPFLQLAKVTLQDFGIVPGSIAIAIVDYRGRLIEGDIPGQRGTLAGSAWIDRVIGGETYAEYFDESGMILVAMPIEFGATGRPEGILAGWLDLGRLVAETARESSSKIRITRNAAASGVGVPRLALKGPLGELGLFLESPSEYATVREQLAGAVGIYVLIMLPLLAVSVWLAWLLGNRLGDPVMRLAVWAAELKGRRLTRPPELANSTPEIRQLVAALETAIANIEKNESSLAQFRLALDSTQAGAVIVDCGQPDWPVIYANQGFTAISGYPVSEVIGRNLRFLHQQDSGQHELETLRNALREARACRVKLRNQRKDGREFWNDLNVAPIFSADGRLTHYVGVQIDITDRLDTEAKLREAQKLEAIGQLTGGLAHDFNNLLGMIVGNLDRMGESLPDDARIRGMHRTALEAALRGADVTRALLAVARKQRLEVKVTDVNALIREAMPLIHATSGGNMSVSEELEPGPLWAEIDAGGFSNVLLNLAINARDAMKESDRKALTVRSSRRHLEAPPREGVSAGDYVVVEVSDTGSGMPAQVLAHVFEPFFTTKKQGEGTGLGLPMTRGYVEQVNGSVQIDTEVGRGTTIRILLPLVAGEAVTADKAPEPATKAAPAASADEPAAGAAGRVLIVDDEEGLRELAADWIADLGYEVILASSGEEAMAKMRDHRIDILFTDVMMPGAVDGVALAEHAVAAQPGIRIILTSGYAKSLLHRSNLPGEYLRKPYRRRDLVRLISGPEKAPAGQ